MDKKDTIIVTIYHKPHGRTEDIEITNIYEEDALFINDNNIKVSMEEDGAGHFVTYFDYGARTEDGEPIEHIELSGSKSCQDTIKNAVEKIRLLI